MAARKVMIKPIVLLADANLLVKDVVSATLFDLNKAELISLHWTPEIEVEYIKHRARLRAEKNNRKTQIEDLIWASSRIEINKKFLVPNYLPKNWIVEKTLSLMINDSTYKSLVTIPDKYDVHVAMAAAFLATSLNKSIILATDNLNDFPSNTLKPFNVIALHPGDILELLYQKDPELLSASLLKTCNDFKNPKISPYDFLKSISSKDQFDNHDLAELIRVTWTKNLGYKKIRGLV